MFGSFNPKKEAASDELATAIDFNEYVVAFSQAVIGTLNTYSDSTNASLTQKLMNVALGVNPHVVFSKSGLPIVVEEVFNDELFSTALMKITFNFFTRIMFIPKGKSKLVLSLTESICFNNGENNLVPNEIKNRLLSKEEIFSALTDNNWLVSYLFLILLGNVIFGDKLEYGKT